MTSSRRPPAALSTRHALLLVSAFAAVYLVWGSTYLAIHVVVRHLPPFLTAGLRSSSAGVILLAWGCALGTAAASRRQWRDGAIAGTLMFLVGHGTLFWASQHVASGLAAIFVATIPIWTAGFGAFGAGRRTPGPLTLAGLLLGTSGVVWVSLPRGGQAKVHPEPIDGPSRTSVSEPLGG